MYQFHNTSDTAPMRLKWSQADGRWLKQNGENLGSFLYRLQNEEKPYYTRIVKYIRLVLPFFDDFDLYPEFGQILLRWKEKGTNKVFNAGQASDGMLRTIALISLLGQNPKDLPAVLFLDEPTTGVDTVSRKEFWEMLKRLKQQGITILVSTPYMDEATLCERIALIQNGKILSIDTPDEIVKQFPENLFAVKANDMSKLLNDLRKNNEIKTCNAFGEFHHITFQNDNENSHNELIHILQKANHQNIELKHITPSIEDCFIKLMN